MSTASQYGQSEWQCCKMCRCQSSYQPAVVVQPIHKGKNAAGWSECPGLSRYVQCRSRAIDPQWQRDAECNVANWNGPDHKYSAGWECRASMDIMLLGWHLLGSKLACCRRMASPARCASASQFTVIDSRCGSVDRTAMSSNGNTPWQIPRCVRLQGIVPLHCFMKRRGCELLA